MAFWVMHRMDVVVQAVLQPQALLTVDYCALGPMKTASVVLAPGGKFAGHKQVNHLQAISFTDVPVQVVIGRVILLTVGYCTLEKTRTASVDWLLDEV